MLRLKGGLAIAKLKPRSLFISLLLMPKKAFHNVEIREMKSESGYSLAIASQPFENKMKKIW